MSYDSLLINTCDIIQRTPDKWGQTSDVIQAGVKCRIMYGNRLVRDFNGEEVLSSAKIFFRSTVNIGHEDMIRFGGVKHAVLKILRPQDSIAIHHVEVYVA